MGGKITELIPVGRKNAVPLVDLSVKTNLSERAVQKEILESRLRGELIISGNEGYYYPAELADLREYVIRRKASIKTAAEALRPFVNALKGGNR